MPEKDRKTTAGFDGSGFLSARRQRGKEIFAIIKEALINSALHLGVSFLPCHRQGILRIALAMRPIRFLGKTKNLYQSDGLHFISAS